MHRGALLHYVPRDGVYTYFRGAPGGRAEVMVVLNKNDAAQALGLSRFAAPLQGRRRARDVISGELRPLQEACVLAPRSAGVYELLD